MISTSEASNLIAASFPDLSAEPCPLVEAQGRVLREAIVADRDHPPFDRVTMDGIALASARVRAGQRRFAIESIQPAGAPEGALNHSENCIEVMTGALMPRGTDSVVRIEDVVVADGMAELREGMEAAPGQHVHRRASDLPQGSVIVREGTRLYAPQIAAASSVGKTTVLVSHGPSVALISTGDELVDLGDTPLPHQIRRSNVYAIRAALAQRGISKVQMVHFSDDPAELRKGLAEILERVELLVLSGGVSMGKFDYVPAVLHKLNVTKVFHKVNQRPGKPLWFGRGPQGQPVFALPGNPVSSLVCAHRYLFPQLDRAMGVEPGTETAVLTERVAFQPAMTYFLPVRLQSDEKGVSEATPAPVNGSGDLSGLARSDGFVELDAGLESFPAGYVAPVYRWKP